MLDIIITYHMNSFPEASSQSDHLSCTLEIALNTFFLLFFVDRSLLPICIFVVMHGS